MNLYSIFLNAKKLQRELSNSYDSFNMTLNFGTIKKGHTDIFKIDFTGKERILAHFRR